MSVGHVIAVVGPSGVGKDSVMAGLHAADPTLQIVRRTITRAPELGGESFDPVDDARFAQMVNVRAFCLHWRAHDLSYGIPTDIRDRVLQGQSFLINLSRTVLSDAPAVFPDFTVLRLTARADTLVDRLTLRGRETADGIRARLRHAGADIPDHLRCVEVSNDGTLEETVAASLAALQRVKA